MLSLKNGFLPPIHSLKIQQASSSMDLSHFLPATTVLADYTWRPGIGARWIWWISAAHLIAAWLCFRAAKNEHPAWDVKRTSGLSQFWVVLTLFMLALFLNKILDLQSVVTLVLRKQAYAEGWYAKRRSIQLIFTVISIAIGVMGLIVSYYWLRGYWRQRSLAYFAAAFLFILVAIRTASYHPVDVILYLQPGLGNRVNAGLELDGALLVSIGAFLSHRSMAPPTHGSAVRHN